MIYLWQCKTQSISSVVVSDFGVTSISMTLVTVWFIWLAQFKSISAVFCLWYPQCATAPCLDDWLRPLMAITWDARQPSEHKLLSTAVQCRHLLARCAWSFSLRPRCNNLHVCRVTLARHIRQSMRSSVHMLSVCLLPCFVCLSPLSDQTKAGLTIAREWCGSIMARLAVPGHCLPGWLAGWLLPCQRIHRRPKP